MTNMYKFGEKIFNATHMKNLKKLKRYLESLPKDYGGFDIEAYAYAEKGKESGYMLTPGKIEKYDEIPCGTVCCVLGHAPAAGIKPQSIKAKKDWEEFSIENFGGSLSQYGVTAQNRVMRYLFHGNNQNSIKSAVNRINNVLVEKGRYTRRLHDIMRKNADRQAMVF